MSLRSLRVVDVERWDPAAVRAVADAAGRRAHAADVVAQVLRDCRVPWSGRAAGSAGRQLDRITAEIVAGADAARAAAGAVADAAERIATVRAALHAGVPRDSVIADAESVDAGLAASLLSVSTTGAPPPQAPAAPRFPPPATSPDAVRRWWTALDDGERETLLSECPDRIGNLDGIPVEARDRANRALLDRDLSAGTGDVRANAEGVSEGLFVNSARTGSPTYLVSYQPDRFGGQGRAAIAIGDPDTATHTAVLVPGTGASVASGWLAEDTDPANLFNEIACATAGPSAVVAWMGYDSPSSLVDPRVGLPHLARRGGELLAADVDALRATARPEAHLTVIGHSYGATTVADAAAASGMRADDVVLAGSPGTDLAHTAADFHLPATGHVFVGSASTDPVTFLAGTRGQIPGTGLPTGVAGLGADPAADGFGSTRFRAETPGFGMAIWQDHGGYFTPGSESLFSIADIAGGDGELLAEHGMTAAHRNSVLGRLASGLALPNWSNPLDDPELVRPGTGGHVHRVP